MRDVAFSKWDRVSHYGAGGDYKGSRVMNGRCAAVGQQKRRQRGDKSVICGGCNELEREGAKVEEVRRKSAGDSTQRAKEKGEAFWGCSGHKSRK